jgi:NAD-dependent dihydropyrimidine dehydrogenase PreA subunit
MKLARLALLMLKQSRNKFLITPKLIDCFEDVISEQQADFLLRAGIKRYRYDELLTLSGWTENEFRPFFSEILRKGLMVTWEDGLGNLTYDLGAIVVGWIEQVLLDGKIDDQRIAFTKDFDAYMSSFRFVQESPLRPIANAYFSRNNTPTLRISGMKLGSDQDPATTLPVGVSLPTGSQHIHPGDAILAYLEKAGSNKAIALVHCFCRQWRNIMEQPCRFGHNAESCIIVGHMAKHIINSQTGRAIALEEAITVVGEARKRGAVHTIFHDRDDLDLPEVAICNCCWDCCGFLGTFNRGYNGYSCRAHYQTVQARPEDCIQCKKCVRFCPVGAIQAGDDDTIHVAPERCIGCGQCAFQCPQQVYDLRRSDRNVYLPAPRQAEARIR